MGVSVDATVTLFEHLGSKLQHVAFVAHVRLGDQRQHSGHEHRRPAPFARRTTHDRFFIYIHSIERSRLHLHTAPKKTN